MHLAEHLSHLYVVRSFPEVSDIEYQPPSVANGDTLVMNPLHLADGTTLKATSM